jgi:hypothetical protein
MTPTLWTGIVVIVIMLEVVRIGITTYVLLHILDSRALRRPDEAPGQAGRSLRSARARARREALADPTLVALRAALDDVAARRRGAGAQAAVTALDRYIAALRDEQMESAA